MHVVFIVIAARIELEKCIGGKRVIFIVGAVYLNACRLSVVSSNSCGRMTPKTISVGYLPDTDKMKLVAVQSALIFP